MNTGIVRTVLALTAMISLSGCGTTSVQPPDVAKDRPILSAAEADSMIRVEFRSLEPTSLERTVASAD